MKKLLLLLLMPLAALPTQAATPDGDDNLYVVMNGSRETAVYSLGELNKITFNSNGVQLWNTAWPTEYAYSKVRVLKFRDNKNVATGVTRTTRDGGPRIRFRPDDGTVRVVGSRPLTGVTVYDAQGRTVASDSHAAADYRLSLSHLPKGIYVVKAFAEGEVFTQKILK